MDSLDNLVITATLIAHLDKSLVLPGGLDHKLSLSGIVTTRLFYVNMLTGRACKDSCWCMPEIRGSNCQCINLTIIQNFTEVSYSLNG